MRPADCRINPVAPPGDIWRPVRLLHRHYDDRYCTARVLGLIFAFPPASWKVDGTMALDVAGDETLLAPALQVTWIGPQRPVEGGTVFVKPLVEDDAAENEVTADSAS